MSYLKGILKKEGLVFLGICLAKPLWWPPANMGGTDVYPGFLTSYFTSGVVYNSIVIIVSEANAGGAAGNQINHYYH